jgi:hypothetical protein
MAEGFCHHCGKHGALCTGLCHNCYMNAWYHRNKDRVKPIIRNKSKELALGVISAYGGKCECCGEGNPAFLTIGTGLKGESQQIGRHGGGRNLYSWLKSHGFPRDNYKLLCRNCNASLKIFGYCPHKTETPLLPTGGSVAERKKRYRAKLKLGIIDAYGGSCSLCGEPHQEFLVVDHINGGGKVHRKKLRESGQDLYVMLRDSGYPKDEYRLLCFNCNDARKL